MKKLIINPSRKFSLKAKIDKSQGFSQLCDWKNFWVTQKISSKLNLEKNIVLLKTKTAEVRKIKMSEEVEKHEDKFVFIEYVKILRRKINVLCNKRKLTLYR